MFLYLESFLPRHDNVRQIMKRRLSVLAAVCLAPFIAYSSLAQQKSDAASKVLALEAKWNEAYKRGDIATMNSLLAGDFIITVEDGATYSKAGYIAHTSGGATVVEISDMTDLKVRVHGNTAVVTGAYHEKGTIKGKPYEYHDRFTDVWMNLDGRWQVIASHYSIPVQ
jgi:ketosteroid isomerase-like protein